MRLFRVVLVYLGLVMLVVGTFNGCSTLFTWNGRHPLAVVPLADEAVTHTLTPAAGRRYTLSVEVVFDREGLDATEDGIASVQAQLPLVVHVTDAAGTSLANVVGTLDPNESPNVLYGKGAHEGMRGGMPELVAARLIGPFAATSPSSIRIDVTLGADRLAAAPITARRLVIHDDAWPSPIRNAFLVAGIGAVVLFSGTVLVVRGWIRDARRQRRRPA